jgi:tRNA threonylcarbamoyladenosine biosynthesis protein TsaB
VTASDGPGRRPETANDDGRRRPLVVIDTATSAIVVATATPDGRLEAATTWPAGHRHGETLLPTLTRFLGEQNLDRARLAGVIVGTGPGTFTGLRVGLATAKGIALSLGIPLVGIATSEALLAAAEDAGIGQADGLTLLLPAGPWDRVMIRTGEPPRILPSGEEPDSDPDTTIALDLAGRATEAAVERGERARRGLPAALAGLGAERLARRPDGDDLAGLSPEYVTLPRGVHEAPAGGVALTVE